MLRIVADFGTVIVDDSRQRHARKMGHQGGHQQRQTLGQVG
ncbi:MAG: hypothetical protein R3C01_07225 [Planctomycetaceae bacterium]